VWWPIDSCDLGSKFIIIKFNNGILSTKTYNSCFRAMETINDSSLRMDFISQNINLSSDSFQKNFPFTKRSRFDIKKNQILTK